MSLEVREQSSKFIMKIPTQSVSEQSHGALIIETQSSNFNLSMIPVLRLLLIRGPSLRCDDVMWGAQG